MFASGPCHLLCDPPYVPLGSTCTCRMDPTSTLLSAGAHSGSVPGFKEYGSAGIQRVSVHRQLLFLPVSSISLRAGTVLPLSSAPPPPPHD